MVDFKEKVERRQKKVNTHQGPAMVKLVSHDRDLALIQELPGQDQDHVRRGQDHDQNLRNQKPMLSLDLTQELRARSGRVQIIQKSRILAQKKKSGGNSSASSNGSQSSNGSKSKKLKKASSRKPSKKMAHSTLSNDSDTEDEDLSKGSKNKGSLENETSGATWKDEFDDGMDDELMGDQSDRENLENMTEREREEELFKRAERREEMKKRYEITQKLKLQQKNKTNVGDDNDDANKGYYTSLDENIPSTSIDENVSSNSRKRNYGEKYDKKFSALSELKAKREEKEKRDRQKKEKENKNKPKKENLSESESGSDLEKLGRKSQKKSVLKASEVYSSSSDDDKKREERRRSSSSSSKSSSSVSSISSGESDTERLKSKKVVKKAKNLETVDQLEKIRLSRFKLEKFVHLPIFKRVAVGCFVKIGIGINPQSKKQVYRVAEIIDICETAKTYGLGKAKCRTNIGLRLRHSKDERVYRLEFISNQHFTESEFIKWKNSCEEAHVELPNVQCIEQKVRDIEKGLTYRFSSADVDKILASKEKFKRHPVNYAMHKSKLQKQKLEAEETGNEKEVERLTQTLLEVEQRAEELDAKRTSTISAVALVNDRNRKANIVKAEKAINEEIRQTKITGKVLDPFTRRKTVPKLPSAKSGGGGDEAMTSELLFKLQEAKDKEDMTQKDKNKEKEDEDEKKKLFLQSFDIKLPKALREKAKDTTDMFSAHNFDIEINVNEMQDTSMPVSIALKPVTTSAKPLTGPTKRSLKIDEWKKKRGII